MTDTRQSGGLHIIFSIFLGLMLTAFAGVGVYTFHPPPEQFNNEIRELERQEQAIRISKPEQELTPADRDRIQKIVRQRNKLVDAAEQARKQWTLGTSIILIIFATFAMAVSLLRSDRMPVISNGLLLGGVFAMLYGVGWIATSSTSITRFLVMTAAFVTALGLGYLRFVRRSTRPSAAAESGTTEVGEYVDIDRRLQELEQRMDEAAQALTRRHDNSGVS
jgi:hypothetical protein